MVASSFCHDRKSPLDRQIGMESLVINWAKEEAKMAK